MKKTYPSVAKQLVILGFCVQVALCASQARAKAHIPGYYGNMADVLPPAATALPTGAAVIAGVDTIASSAGKMTVHQDQPRAVIHWQDFNIGSQASVHFEQETSSWKALNRVTGDGYSRIYGSLTAKGQVYLLNQNGILFGPGSTVNVHSLTASALNLDDDDFLNLPDFADGGKETYTYNASYPLDAAVANHGEITAGSLGSVFLIGPQVENHGTITAQGGHVGLFAGERVELSQYTGNTKDTKFDILVEGGDTPGTAANFSSGEIITERGWSGMYGSFVNQDGLIRAVTALEKNGRIELRATNRVRTGANSLTEAPVSDSGERKVVDESSFDKSEIIITADEGSIEHYGRIFAPGGEVTLNARDRVYLEEGSSIDVSGSWVELAAEDHMVEVQLNSEELRDAYIYKNGPLKGETIQVDIVTGLSFADISGYLDSMEKSAPELTTNGGSIRLTATGDNGEVIVKQGAELNFSGGGLIYSDGLVPATKVRVGNRIYGLHELPSGVPIDEVLGYYSREHERYGISDEWLGIYYGGSSPYLSYLSAFKQGANGGQLFINGRKVILNGSMNASVQRGIYQNTLEDPLDENGKIAAVGRAVPRAGTLAIGSSYYNTQDNNNDLVTDAIIVKKTVTPTIVSSDEALPDNNDDIRLTELSADKINEAGLGGLRLYANAAIEIENDAEVELSELGTANFMSRNIVHRGTMRVPSGSVDFTLLGIPGSDVLDTRERIYLADNSIIDVSGSRLDNAAVEPGQPWEFGFTHGGEVHLLDENYGADGEIIMARTSVINASGGYMINRDTSVTGGNAGSIKIRGNTVRPDGILAGLALEGSEGGKISIHADEMTVAKTAPLLPDDFDADAELPMELKNHLVLADNRFANSGFTHIELKSETDLTVEKGINLTLSSVRLAEPELTTTGYQLEESKMMTARPEYFGPASITLAAGQKIFDDREGKVFVEEDASLTVASGNGNSITLTGKNGVTMAGGLIAHGGDVAVEATDTGDVILAASAMVDVSGITLPDPENSMPRLVLNHSVIDGGAVSLSAAKDVALETGSLVDVSGSEAVTNRTLDRKGKIIETTTASAAGSVSIEYNNDFINNGTLLGRSSLPWLAGSSLTVAKTGNTTFTVNEANVTSWQRSGFDDFTFSSRREIDFIESAMDNDDTISIETGRGLALNTSAIIGSEGQKINLSAPWLRLSNVVIGTTGDPQKERIFGDVATGSASLSISGEFIDIEGNVALSGFAQTTLKSTNDLRLFDYYYNSPEKTWSGALRTAGDLTLQAAAIYPGMHHSMDTWDSQDNTHKIYPSSFTISSGLTDADGNILEGEGSKITILTPEQPLDRDIFSAGGRLKLKAGDIEHHGVLAAPMGEIELAAENRVGLCEGSVLSTRGENIVLYGMLAEEQWTVGGWRDNETPAPTIPVTAPPEKAVNITADEIIQSPEALINVGGGGSIFAYEFLPGYDGSDNPLGKENRYVILPDNSVILPGRTVYLEGMEGLESGTYSLLPAEYAFLPGALIIEAAGETMLPGRQLVTPAGYTMIAGHESERSISTPSPLRSGYIVRDAKDVLTEGRFDIKEMTAGDGGMVAASGSTTLLAGPILGDALDGYRDGSLALGGTDLLVGLNASLPDDNWWQSLTFETEIPAELAGRMILDTSRIKEKGLRTLQLGGEETETITIAANSKINDIPVVEMNAAQSITLEERAEIHGLEDESGQGGELVLNTATLYGTDSSLLHAANLLRFNIDNLSAYTFTGDIQVDHGTFQLSSDLIYLEPAGYTGARHEEGFYLSADMLEEFKTIDHVILESASDMVFLGNVGIEAGGNLTLDTASFKVDNSLTTDPTWGPPMAYPCTVNIGAGRELRLRNSNAQTDADIPGDYSLDINRINLAGETILFGPGEMTFDNFKAIDFAGSGDIVFNGTGSLTADLAAGSSLTLSAARYISAMTQETRTEDDSEILFFELSDFLLDAGSGDIVMTGNGRSGSAALAMPGTLTVSGANISLKDALFDMPGGFLDFQADDSIILENSTVRARGESLDFPVSIGGTTYDNTIFLSGGNIDMRAGSGEIVIDDNSLLDTSADDGREGGGIVLAAPEGGVILDGTIKGSAITIDTTAIDDFGKLARKIETGGFEKEIDLRARTGDVVIDYGDTVETDHFRLTADQGAIDIWGMIDASGDEQGGTVEIYAENDLTLQSTGQILAKGNGEMAEGGRVFLASESGAVNTFALPPEYGAYSSLIDVSGNSLGGRVTFRTQRDMIGASILDGEIVGASRTTMQAFRVYDDSNVTSTDVNSYMNDIGNEWPALEALWQYDDIDLVAEIEVRSSGDLTLASGLDDLNDFTINDLGGNPGVLTFRAAEDLKVTGNIIDAPESSLQFNWLTYRNEYVPVTDGIRDSWGLNFVAGADLGSANRMAVHHGTGDFVVGRSGDGKVIYTESGDINFTAGNDVIIHALKTTGSGTTVPELYMPGTDRYNLASFDGDINGCSGGNLLLEGGIIQTAVSDINLRAGNNVEINPYSRGSQKWYGAIRTTGRAPLADDIPEFDPFRDDPLYSFYLDAFALERYWDYGDGGDITLAAGGDIMGSVAQPDNMGWDYAYDDILTADYLGLDQLEKYGAAYGMAGMMNGSVSGHTTHGIATMSGGSIDIRAEDIYTQVGAFMEGDVDIYARGDLDGRFLAADGDMHLTSLVSFGNAADNLDREDTLVELGSGSLAIQALGNISLGTICNPVFTRLGEGKDRTWLLTYDEDSSVNLNSALGDIIFSGSHDFAEQSNIYRNYLLPSSLTAVAGRDILFSLSRSNPFILAPSTGGQLALAVGRDINGKTASSRDAATYNNSMIFMSAADPGKVYGDKGAIGRAKDDDMVDLLKYGNTAPDPLHIDNFRPVEIRAGRDIANISLSVPNQTAITAERDIREIGYWGQNPRQTDVSLVSAGRDLVQQPYEGKNLDALYINQAGGGFLLVLAGGSIDLGSSRGIRSTGNDIGAGTDYTFRFKDSDLDNFNRHKGADVGVISGYDLEMSSEEFADFFLRLSEKGREFSRLLATGEEEDENEAARLKQEMLDSIINPLLAGKKSGSGDIAMTQSTIKTESGRDDLYIIAGGRIDVGTSIISDEKDTSKGILTEGGGSINVFAENDINVNESRVVSYFGGDILMLSNHGDINAGRGSKTAVSPMAAGYINVGGKLVDKFAAPAPGSGIRTLTADPDGAGPVGEPEQGAIYLIAWEGVIDAGEAGISASNIILAATKILNSENISFSDSGVGVPVTADAGPSLGAMAGSSTVSESQSASESMGRMVDSGKGLAEAMSKMAENLNMKMLVFKVIDFKDEMTAKPEEINSGSGDGFNGSI